MHLLAERSFKVYVFAVTGVGGRAEEIVDGQILNAIALPCSVCRLGAVPRRRELRAVRAAEAGREAVEGEEAGRGPGTRLVQQEPPAAAAAKELKEAPGLSPRLERRPFERRAEILQDHRA